MTGRILCTIAIGTALFLLGACARQGQPTASPTHTLLAVATVAPAPTPSPSPPPSAEPLTHPLTFTNPDPSAADLAIQAIPGEAGVYTLTVRNLGPDPASGIVLTDVLPSGVTPLWAEPAQPVCGRQERDVGCDLGDLRAGDAATVTLGLSVIGVETALTSTQPAGVSLDLSWPTCAIDRDSDPPHVTCQLNKLQPGTDVQMHIGYTVAGSLTEMRAHAATVTANEADPDLSNNRATITLAVDAAAPMTATAVPTTTDLVLQADGPVSVIAGQPFTYTYTINNRGALEATDVWFEDVVPSDLNLVAYAPGLPWCEQQADRFTCRLHALDSSETVTFTLAITGHGAQPLQFELDPLLPGWPICFVVKERTWQHIVYCEIGVLRPGQAARVQLALEAIGTRERTTANTASVVSGETDLNPLDNTSTTTITVQVSGTPGGN